MPHLSDVEQSVVDEVNLARTRPRDYAGCVHSVSMRGHLQNGTDELFNVLRVRSPVANVKTSKGLSSAAKKRAEAVACGMQAHEPGLDLAKRVAHYGSVEDPTSLKEVVWIGRYGDDIRRAVLSMLADESNPTRSRRTSLLSSTAGICGAACSGNVICIILCKSFYEGTSNASPMYGRSFAGKLDEPSPQMPVRQVMTPMHTRAQQHTQDMYSPGGTPRLNDYDDLRKIINTMPVSRRREEAEASLNRTHERAERAHERNHERAYAAATPVTSTRNTTQATTGVRTSQPTPAKVVSRREMPSVRDTPTETTKPSTYGSGVIVGLESIKTTLMNDNGESNYVGFNSSLKDRIGKWLHTIHYPTVVA